MTLLHPLKSRLQLGSICMAEILQKHWSNSKKVLYLQYEWQKKVTAMSKLLLQFRHKCIILRQLLLVILLKSAKVLVLLELYAGWESAITLRGYSRHFLTEFS
jgi:hypothetical protein